MVVKKSWSVRLSYICQLHVGYIYIYIRLNNIIYIISYIISDMYI